MTWGFAKTTGSAQYAGTLADGGAASLALTKTGAGNWTFGGVGVGIGTYSGDTTISGGTVDRSNPGGAPICTLTLGNGDASGSFSGRLRNTGSGATLNVTKTGTGTQTLSGANTYTGTTIVNGGKLLVDSPGSLAAGSVVTVNSSATLGGSGTINGSVTVNAGGTVSAGDSPGTLTLANGLNLSAGGTNVWELGANSDANPGVDFDQIVPTGGTLTLGGSSTLSIRFTGTATVPNVSEPFCQTTHSWTVISASGAASNFAAIQNGVYPASTFTTSVEAGGIVLTFTPSTGATPVSSLSIAKGPGSDMTLIYSGGSGSQFVLLQTNNVTAAMTNWTRVKTNASTPGTFTVTPGSDPREFYRVKSE